MAATEADEESKFLGGLGLILVETLLRWRLRR